MKLTTRGFTLVELMIVIAIIGILAATLFPSLTGYLARGRDTGRVGDLRAIGLVLSSNTTQGAALPASSPAGCLPSALSGMTTTPTDPTRTKSNMSCSSAAGSGAYAYGTGTSSGLGTMYVLGVALEGQRGNTGAVSTLPTTSLDNTPKVLGVGTGYLLAGE